MARHHKLPPDYEKIVPRNAPAGRPWIPRVSFSEHYLRLVFGARHGDRQCRSCRAFGPCKVGCSGDGDRPGHPERVTPLEASRRRQSKRRVKEQSCESCGVGDRCRVECPGDGPIVRYEQASGHYLITSRPLRTPVALRQWRMEAERRGLAVVLYDVDGFDPWLAKAQEEAEIADVAAILEGWRAAVEALRRKRGLKGLPDLPPSSSSCPDTPVG